MTMYRGTLNDFINYLNRRNPMIDTLRPFISRIIAPLITGALAWTALHGFDFGQDAASHVTDYAVVVIVAGMQMVNGVVHKTIDKKANPADAATTSVAIAGKIADKDPNLTAGG